MLNPNRAFLDRHDSTETLVLSPGTIEDFYRRSWPWLVAEASRRNTTVTDLFSERFELYELFMEELHGRFSRGSRWRLARMLDGVSQLEFFPPALYDVRAGSARVLEAYKATYVLAYFVTYIRSFQAPAPALFNPESPFTRPRVIQIFREIDALGMDGVADYAQRFRAERLGRETAAAAARAAAERRATPPPARGRTEPAPPEPWPLSEEGDPVLLPVPRRSWYREDIIYSLRTARGDVWRVSFGREIAGERNPDEQRTIMRLLSSMILGDGDQRGVKMLATSGAGVVEVKAAMRGAHKRLLGCLAGDRIHLAWYRETPTNVSGYSRMIPSNFCAELLRAQAL